MARSLFTFFKLTPSKFSESAYAKSFREFFDKFVYHLFHVTGVRFFGKYQSMRSHSSSILSNFKYLNSSVIIDKTQSWIRQDLHSTISVLTKLIFVILCHWNAFSREVSIMYLFGNHGLFLSSVFSEDHTTALVFSQSRCMISEVF